MSGKRNSPVHGTAALQDTIAREYFSGAAAEDLIKKYGDEAARMFGPDPSWSHRSVVFPVLWDPWDFMKILSIPAAGILSSTAIRSVLRDLECGLPSEPSNLAWLAFLHHLYDNREKFFAGKKGREAFEVFLRECCDTAPRGGTLLMHIFTRDEWERWDGPEIMNLVRTNGPQKPLLLTRYLWTFAWMFTEMMRIEAARQCKSGERARFRFGGDCIKPAEVVSLSLDAFETAGLEPPLSLITDIFFMLENYILAGYPVTAADLAALARTHKNLKGGSLAGMLAELLVSSGTEDHSVVTPTFLVVEWGNRLTRCGSAAGLLATPIHPSPEAFRTLTSAMPRIAGRKDGGIYLLDYLLAFVTHTARISGVFGDNRARTGSLSGKGVDMSRSKPVFGPDMDDRLISIISGDDSGVLLSVIKDALSDDLVKEALIPSFPGLVSRIVLSMAMERPELPNDERGL